MSLSVNLEIMISLQIVCEETHSTFKGHKDCSHGKHIQFCLSQRTATAFNEAFDINFIQMKITGHLRQIFLILCSGTCAKTDRIAEIIYGKSRHYGIKVNHTDGFSRCIINHNVIQLGIIMCNTQRQLSLILHIAQDMCQFCAVQHKLNLFFHICCSVTYIFFHSSFKLIQPVHRIMKIYDGLMKSFCRIVCKQPLEMSESNCTLVKIFLIFYHVIACGIFNEQIYSPVFPVLIYIIRKSILCHHKIQSLSLHISTVFLDLFLQPGSNTADILHQFHRFGKNTPVHFLKNIMFACTVSQSVSIIDMSASIRNTFCQIIFQNKCTGDILYLPVNFHSIIPPIISVDTALHLLNSEWQLLPQVYLLCRLHHTIYP